MNYFLKIDEKKCLCCGICAEECVSGAIGMGDSGPKQVSDYCISCAHCVAACPVGALDNDRCPLAGQTPYDESGYPDSTSVELMLRSRRSIRCYKDKAVPRGLVEKLLNLARLAPSGGNTQGIRYLAIDEPEVLTKLTEAVIIWMEDLVSSGLPNAPFMKNFISRYRQDGLDVVLWGAPCLVLASANLDKRIPNPRENTIFSLLYAQLYAPCLGLGTCWAGAVEMAVSSGHQAVAEVLRPYGEQKFTGAMMLGFPKHRFYRLADRDPLELSWG